MIEQGKCGDCRWFVPEKGVNIKSGSPVEDIDKIEGLIRLVTGESGGSVVPSYGHCTVWGVKFGKMSNWPCSEWEEDIDGVRHYLFDHKSP